MKKIGRCILDDFSQNRQSEDYPAEDLEISVPVDFEGIPILTEGIQEEILNPKKEDDEDEDTGGVKFRLPGFGMKAYKDFNKLAKEKTGDAEESPKPQAPAQSVDDMTRILNMQAAKIHGKPPRRAPGDAGGSNGTADTGEKMIVGLSGAYAGDSPPKAVVNPRGEQPLTDGEFDDVLEFLEESIEQYNAYVENIGRNGLAAANLGYFRDEIQEVLDMLKYEEKVNLRPYWEIIVRIDMELRAKAPLYVREVGYENFKQYQIVNDPPLTSWWWYLNRTVAPPAVQPKFWEIWKK